MGWESAQAALLLTHPPNPKLSGPTGQRWTRQDPAALRVQAAARWPQPQWQGPPSSRLDKVGGGSQDGSHIWAGHSCLQPGSSSAWPAVLAVTAPFWGSGPHPPSGELFTLPVKLWGPNSSSPEFGFCLVSVGLGF